MKNDDEIFESLIAGGIIGAALGALVSKDNEEGAALGALAGAAILATYRASEQAKQTKLPMYLEEKGDLFLISGDGHKQFVRKIQKPTGPFRKNFKLK